MITKTGSKPDQERRQQTQERRDHTNLDRRYGAIGIASVAAALRYTAPLRKAADAPKTPRIELRFIEVAA